MCTQDWEVVCIAAQDVCLVLDPRRCVLLKDQRPLGDDRVPQLSGRPVQKHNIDVGRPQDSGQLMSKDDYRSPPVDRGIDQNGKVIVAHRTCVTLDLRAKEVHQMHTTLVPEYGGQFVLEQLGFHGAECTIEPAFAQLPCRNQGSAEPAELAEIAQNARTQTTSSGVHNRPSPFALKARLLL